MAAIKNTPILVALVIGGGETKMNKRYESTINENRFKKTGDFIRSLDVRTWLVIALMLAVLTVMMGLNANAWSKFLPVWIAYSLSAFMEIGALVWKFADERPRNSDDQQSLTSFLVWMNVILAVLLMIINLLRSEEISGNGWATADYFAFSFVAISALGHVSGALLFRQFDEMIGNRRKIAKQYSRSEYESERAKGILADTENRLKIREMIADNIEKLRKKYSGTLSEQELEKYLRDAQNALEEQYDFDYNEDGVIGSPSKNS